jgi:putative Holliday junction resolvase
MIDDDRRTAGGQRNATGSERARWQPGGRLLGLDIGSRRIGVAVSDEQGLIASPVGYVRRGAQEAAGLAEQIQRWGPVGLVVGLPVGLSGREGPQAADVRSFAEEELEQFGLPVRYLDERLTTTIAERALIASGTRRSARKEQVDAMAAAVILQGYLDAERERYARRRS